MAVWQINPGGTPGGPFVDVMLPPGTCRRVWLQATQGVTGATLALLPTGLNTGTPDLPQTFTPAVGLPHAQTTGIPVPDDRVWARLTFQGGPTDRIGLVVDDGRPCCPP